MNIKLDSIVSISYSTIGGAILGGPMGGVLGFTTSTIDHIFINNQIIDKHYLSLSTFWYVSSFSYAAEIVSKFVPYHKTIKFASYGLSMIFSYYVDDFVDFSYKLTMPLESFYLSNKLFDDNEIVSSAEVEKIYNLFWESPKDSLALLQKDIKKIYENEFLTSFIKILGINLSNIVLDYFFIRAFAKYGSGLFLSTLLNENKGVKILSTGAKIVGYFLIKDIADTFLATYKFKLSKDQFSLMIKKSNNILLESDNGRKIAESESGKELNSKIIFDLYMLSSVGGQTLNKVFYEAVQSLFSFAIVNKNVPKLWMAYSMFSIAQDYFLNDLMVRAVENNIKKAANEEKNWNYIIDIRDNIKELNLRDGGNFIAYKSNVLELEKNALYQEGETLSKLRSFVFLLFSRFNDFINIFFVYKEYLSIEMAAFLIPQVNIANSFLTSNLKARTDSSNIEISLKRMKMRYDEIDKIYSPNLVRSSNTLDKLIFSNYSLSTASKELIHIDQLSFDVGKIYAITGASGCGKTRIMTDLKGGVFGSLVSRGEISFPLINGKMPKIMFIDQEVYLPKGGTLLETIIFPEILSLKSIEEQKEIEEKIIKLFMAMEIDTTNSIDQLLARVDFYLSGGQAKKVVFIQAIMSQADIYIFDETFNDLDQKSIMVAQYLLKTMTKNATFLIIDHHAESNNYNGFYDREVHFVNGSAVEKNISSVFSEELFNNKSNIEEEVCLSALGSEFIDCSEGQPV